jgi:hypothetical protein
MLHDNLGSRPSCPSSKRRTGARREQSESRATRRRKAAGCLQIEDGNDISQCMCEEKNELSRCGTKNATTGALIGPTLSNPFQLGETCAQKTNEEG